MSKQVLRIGTRNSPLAMKQVVILSQALEKAHDDLEIQIIPVQSNADWKKHEGEKPLSEEAGGKGMFAKEIEELLLDGAIDCGVHSLKDMACKLPEGLVIQHYLPRENPNDAFISSQYKSLSDLPKGATIGTCSTRRAAISLNKRPDLNIVPFRGNVQTRINKVMAEQVDATFLAMAGLNRLEIKNDLINEITSSDMLPACGQGAICMEVRENDSKTHKVLEAVNCYETQIAVEAERQVLSVIDGTCHTPISVHATPSDDNQKLSLTVQLYSLDGQHVYEEQSSIENVEGVSVAEAQKLGQETGLKLLNRLPDGFIE